MSVSFEMIEGQRFASRGKEPDNIGILDNNGRTFMIQRRRDGTWSIPLSHIAAWNRDADQDYAAQHYDANEIAELVGADADRFGTAAAFFDRGLGNIEAVATALVFLSAFDCITTWVAGEKGYRQGNGR
jgi:hypothetical protein